MHTVARRNVTVTCAAAASWDIDSWQVLDFQFKRGKIFLCKTCVFTLTKLVLRNSLQGTGFAYDVFIGQSGSIVESHNVIRWVSAQGHLPQALRSCTSSTAGAVRCMLYGRAIEQSTCTGALGLLYWQDTERYALYAAAACSCRKHVQPAPCFEAMRKHQTSVQQLWCSHHCWRHPSAVRVGGCVYSICRLRLACTTAQSTAEVVKNTSRSRLLPNSTQPQGWLIDAATYQVRT